MSIAKRLVVIGVVFLCVFTAGTTAFMLVEGWPFMDALYMTTITIFSVGFQEVHPLETRGRILTILLILGGAGTLAIGFSMVTAFIVEGELRDVLGKRRMEKTSSFFIHSPLGDGKYRHNSMCRPQSRST